MSETLFERKVHKVFKNQDRVASEKRERKRD